MSDEDPLWKQFEKAVAEFLSAIGDGAKITHNATRPDDHTGHPRQRDVWVEGSFGGHFPFKALVSCKRRKKPLSQEDIDHFRGEFLSSNAQIGIIYSKAGFNNRAVEKSRALGFHCCRLYDNEPSELPESLTLGHAYNFRPRFRLSVRGEVGAYDFKTWGQVMDLPAGEGKVLDALTDALESHQDQDNDISDRWIRAKRGSVFEVPTARGGLPRLNVILEVAERSFRSKVECHLLSGSYNVTAGAFLGSESTPWVDPHSAHPGPGWEEVDEIPDEMPKRCIAMFEQMDARANLTKQGKAVFPSKTNDAE